MIARLVASSSAPPG